MNPQELEKLLRDSFANYVVQTAMDYADEETKIRLIDNIRPILNAIRHTPYGRRIQGKIQDYDTRQAGGVAAQLSPSANTTLSPGQNGALFTPRQGPLNNFTSPNGGYGNGANYGGNNMTSPTPHRGATRSLNMMTRPQQTNGFVPANSFTPVNGPTSANGFNQGFTPLGHTPRQTGVSNNY